jgi:nitrate/TMAO reductase-like tetraheme cytochrome c subunit
VKRRRLSVFPAESLHRLGLLIAFVLIVACTEFNSTHSFLTAGLVFIFALGYLFASVITRRAGFLYGAMLFSAVSFFLICYGLGAPITSFPLLSVALVIFLMVVGQYLNRLPDVLRSFPLTVFRVMNITVVVFSAWALAQLSNLMSQEGLIRHVAAFTFLGYAGVYLALLMMNHRSTYTYTFSLFLTLGSMLLAGGLWSVDFCWIAAMASVGVILLIGTGFHREREYNWSRHFYFCSAPIILVSLIFSVWQWPFLMMNLALTSMLLWIAYERLAKAVEGAIGAVMIERVIAKYFFFGAVGLTIPIMPMVFVRPGNLFVALASIICGLTFSLIAWQRRGRTDKDSYYVFAAIMFISAGVLGLGRQLPGISGSIWMLAVPQVTLACLGLLCVFFVKAGDLITHRRIAIAAIFPVFFAWFFMVLQDQFEMAIIAALIVTTVVFYLGARLKERSYYYAIGPSIASIFIAVVLLPKDRIIAWLDWAPVAVSTNVSFIWDSTMAWIACAAAALVTGVLFVWADARGRQIKRGATNLGWLILSIAAISIAWSSGIFGLLCCVTAVGTTAVLIAGRPNRGQRDILELFVQGMALLATTAAILMAALVFIIGLSVVVVGACLLILSAAYWLAWAEQRGRGAARIANALFSLGALLVIFGLFSEVELRLGAGAVIVLILFLLAAMGRNRFCAMANSAVISGHVTSIVLAIAMLIQAWSMSASRLYLAAAPLVVLYAFMPELRENKGLRLGTALWISFAVLLGISALINTPYEQQMHLMVGLSLVWVALGYLLDRTKAKAWSMPLYTTAAVVASFCCVVSIIAPVTNTFTSWLVFLTSGVVFVSLFLIVRDDIYSYLLSVALALMGYGWLRATGSSFTVHILFYLAIAGAILATAFLLPHLLKRITRLGTVPMFSLFTGFGAALLFLVVAAFGAVALGAYGIEITGHPKFCASCHNMEEYYMSWEHSSHKDVACVKCHTEPGVSGTIAAKAQGMVQLVQYIAGSYGTRPHGEISNASCQQGSCHGEVVNDGTVIMLYDKIKFRHDKHLSEHPKGKSLNCVSCHGQTVQGQHISVSKTTCLTCHFYNRGDKQVAAGDCETCHNIPEEEVTFVDEPFSHKDFLAGDGDVTCIHCHSQVTQGSGTVSRVRCMACHLKESGEVENQEEFHLIHVSAGHFDCLTCHDEIKHGESPMAMQLLTSSNCTTCHGGKRHSIQEAIYAGIAVAELETKPDMMYEAGVACDGCHDDSQITQIGGLTLTSRISGAKQCIDCHGNEDYAEELASRQEATKEMLNELGPALAELEKTLQSSQAPAEKLAEAKKLAGSARTKLDIVLKDGSSGAHNANYVMEILDKVLEEIEASQSLIE